MTLVSIRTKKNKISSSALRGDKKPKSQRARLEEHKGQTTEHALAVVEIENKIMLEQDKYLQMTNASGMCLFFFSF